MHCFYKHIRSIKIRTLNGFIKCTTFSVEPKKKEARLTAIDIIQTKHSSQYYSVTRVHPLFDNLQCSIE